MTDRYFHFTLGPVQGFVAQARRTRDFWAGSFILSWLAAVAMKATTAQGGTIKFPAPDDNFMQWLEGKRIGDKPTQGSIPNRFKALIPEGINFKPELVTEAVQTAWQALADKVWEQDLSFLGKQSEAYAIWQRQIPAFWDMSWVIVEDETDSSALDRRKNWRTYAASNEGGVKCTMMEGWQELSGELSPNRKDLDRFWNKVIESGKLGMKSDLSKNETLCSIAFVKRRFSRYFHLVEANFFQKDGYAKDWKIKGWQLPSAIPSVVYMAAVHWYEQALNEANPTDLEAFYNEAVKLTGFQLDEYETRIQCLEKARGKRAWKSLDGNVFFKTMLENKTIFEDQAQAKQVIRALNKVNESANLEPVTPFYAILMMDGDSLGKHMSDIKKQEHITRGLELFTKKVKDIVYNNNGFLIYAGGDDVLAILPLEDAIPCAAALRTHYLTCFDGKIVKTTLSGAIEFAHIKMPLTQVLKDAHALLDKVAKDETGRDALAIRVWKGGGLQIEWAQPWQIVLECQHSELYKNSKLTRPQAMLTLLAERFQENQEKDEYFSSKFFYKLRERFTLLNPPCNKENKITGFSVFKTEEDAIDLMAMEYLNSWGNKGNKDIKEAIQIIGDLLNQCRPRKRDLDIENSANWSQVEYSDLEKNFADRAGIKKGSQDKLHEFKIWEADAALLVRFLAQKGVETR